MIESSSHDMNIGTRTLDFQRFTFDEDFTNDVSVIE